MDFQASQLSCLLTLIMLSLGSHVESTTTTVSVSRITPPGTGTSGESYSLECTVTVTGSDDQPTITWLDPMNSTVSSGVETTGSMSTLTFNSLAVSHAGIYTCRVTLDSATNSTSTTITVQSE